MAKTSKIIASFKSLTEIPRVVEVIGPVGSARSRMLPLDVQRVQDLFAAHDAKTAA